ncbi:MAG: DUF1887 family protein [Ruminococcaceae bacterium]|nr:DUF1887 family protein [Oscillospiraceae bacterium]
MKTLIELYDERPVENVLATEMFRPERTVFLCPAEIAQNKNVHEKLRAYMKHRGLDSELVFLECSQYNTAKIERQLAGVVEKYPECVLDITGGTDAALFAGGLLCARSDMPVFTYSRRQNSFFNIHNAPFAEGVKCDVRYDVSSCFMMAGGALRSGRFDNSILSGYMDDIDQFFAIYMDNKSQWTRFVSYMQKASQTDRDSDYIPLEVSAPYTVKGDRGSRISAPEKVLEDVERLGFIKDLYIKTGSSVSFTFRDLNVRKWLRDVGSVLELYVYKVCRDTGLFCDVQTSAIVDWEGDGKQDNVTNEIDVMAVRGIVPLFISCKTCAVDTEALNELAILRDRFGGEIAKAAIVTTQSCRLVTAHRADELGITVIELDDLRKGRIGDIIKSMMGAK